MNRQSKRLPLLLLVCAGMAVAQEPQPTVAPFSLELRRTPAGFSNKEREELQAEFRRLVRGAGAMVPNAGSMDSALRALKRQDCDRENECLQQLAQKAQTLYGLFASVDYDLAKNVVATGRIVRDDGQLIGELRTITLPKGADSFLAVAQVVLVQLLDALRVKSLPPFREVRTATVEPTKPVEAVKPVEVPVRAEPVAPVKPPPAAVVVDTGEGRRSTGKLLLGAGLGAVVVGGVALGLGASLGGGLTPVDGFLPPDQLEAYKSARALTTVGTVVAGLGAVAAGVGAVLWWTTPDPAVQVAVSPTGDGAIFSVRGNF